MTNFFFGVVVPACEKKSRRLVGKCLGNGMGKREREREQETGGMEHVNGPDRKRGVRGGQDAPPYNSHTVVRK